MGPVGTKVEIINLLIGKYGFTSYLEIAAPTTGFLFGQVARQGLERCDRIVYCCPPDFDDGERIVWRSETASLDAIAAELVRAGRRYDIVFVDSHHTYECSARDLAFAFSLVSDRGLIVMHDAAPPALATTTPDFIAGDWTGQSYAALVDFLLLHPERPVYVVDIDWGVAVIGSAAGAPATAGEAASAWRQLPDDYSTRFAFFEANRAALLNLCSVGDFLRRERLGPFAPRHWRWPTGLWLNHRSVGHGKAIFR